MFTPAVRATRPHCAKPRVCCGSKDDLCDIHKQGGFYQGTPKQCFAKPSAFSRLSVSDLKVQQTGFYPIQCISWKKHPEMNIFSTRDPQEHRDQKRKIASAYTLSNLLQSEEAVDSCSTLFLERLSEFAANKEPVDLGAWLQ